MLATTQVVAAYEPQLQSLTPVGGQRGAQVEVVFQGPRVGADPLEVMLYEPGVTAAQIQSVDGNKTTAVLTIAEDCRLGRHAVRLRTASGISNLVTFHVGALAERAETEPNSTDDQAQQIALGQIVHGIVQSEDVDVFAFDAEAGARLSVEVEGLRLGRSFFDPSIELVDPDGKLIAQSDDATAAYQDAFLSCLAEKTGRYLVRLREVAYRGDSRSHYRLHVGRFPRPTAVYPPAVVTGKPSTVTWIGDPLGEKTEEVQLNNEAEDSLHYVDETGISPSGFKVLVRDAPPALEAEPNNSYDQANAFAVPGLAAGRVQEAGDIDRFRVTLKKDQVWDLRVRARELRSSLDAVLRVREASGKQLAANDDDRGMPD
ncbi:MAG: PPC domain-containing protein, partial [Planctomycetales bacterium]|nr:PPC domain-containing protein [Planctomycetales bacterium]